MKLRVSPARLAAFAAVVTIVCAGSAQAIVGGTPTTDFKATGIGVQVTDNWVLTVNHAALGVGSSYHNGYGSRTVLASYSAPGADGNAANDLSLLRLSSGSGSVPGLAVSSDLFVDGNFPALSVTISSPTNSGPDRGFGFTTVSEFTTLIDPDDGGPSGLVVANYLLSHDTGVHVQSGDSGGGLFLGHVFDATSPLLGLSSALLTDANNQPVGSAFVLLAAYRPWIDQTLAADLTDTQAINWVSSVPEPGALALWALGLTGLAGLMGRMAHTRRHGRTQA